MRVRNVASAEKRILNLGKKKIVFKLQIDITKIFSSKMLKYNISDSFRELDNESNFNQIIIDSRKLRRYFCRNSQ